MIVIIGVFACIMIYATSALPIPGDPLAPASTYVSSYYIEHSMQDANTPNIVTAVLADYRGLDTLGETLVVFTAGLACVLILAGRTRHD